MYFETFNPIKARLTNFHFSLSLLKLKLNLISIDFYYIVLHRIESSVERNFILKAYFIKFLVTLLPHIASAEESQHSWLSREFNGKYEDGTKKLFIDITPHVKHINSELNYVSFHIISPVWMLLLLMWEATMTLESWS